MNQIVEVLPLGWSESGEPIRVPSGATGWRVKLFRPGAKKPDLVRDEYGTPAMVPLQATPEEFRALMGSGGRYRLEPVFSDGRSIADSEPALIVLRESPEEVAAPQQAGGLDSNDLILKLIEEHHRSVAKHHESTSRTHELLNEMMSDHREQVAALAAQNTALVTTLAQNFGNYLSGSAELLKASHPPAPEPRRNALDTLGEFKQIRELCTDLGEPPAPDDVAPAEESPYTELVAEGVRSVMPLLTKVIHKCVLGLSAEQTAALQGDAPPAAAAPAPAQTPTPSAQTTTAAPQASASPRPATPQPQPKEPDFVAHLNAIEKHLTPQDVAAARRVLGTMTPQTITAWRNQLIAMSPSDAAAHVRNQLHPKETPL